MKKLLVLLLFSLAFSYNWKLDFSAYDDGTSFMRESGVNYTFVSENYVLSSVYNETVFGADLKRDFSINYDKVVNKKVSSFIFASYANNTQTKLENARYGAGYSYLINENVLHFPYRNKISLAVVREDDKYILSFRHKFKGYIHKLGIESVLNHLGYTYNVKTKFTYKLDRNVSIFYKDFVEEYNGRYHTTSVGVEVKL